MHVVPKFGVGSKSCAGRENRTDAMSATPMNLISQSAQIPCAFDVSYMQSHGGAVLAKNRKKRLEFRGIIMTLFGNSARV
jgi:hypothetical protein